MAVLPVTTFVRQPDSISSANRAFGRGLLQMARSDVDLASPSGKQVAPSWSAVVVSRCGARRTAGQVSQLSGLGSLGIWLVASPNTTGLVSAEGGVGPGAGEGADDERLPGPGRPDQRLDPGAGGEYSAHGGGLVDAQLDTCGPKLVQEPLRGLAGKRGRIRVGAGGGEQEAFGPEVVGGAVQLRPEDW